MSSISSRVPAQGTGRAHFFGGCDCCCGWAWPRGCADFWSPQAFRAKVKTPLEFMVSAVRAVGGDPDTTPGLAQVIARLGEPLYAQQCFVTAEPLDKLERAELRERHAAEERQEATECSKGRERGESNRLRGDLHFYLLAPP